MFHLGNAEEMAKVNSVPYISTVQFFFI